MNIVLHKNFKKKFNKLPQSLQRKFIDCINIFLTNKFDKRLNNHSLEGAFMNCRSINITGDYRAIFKEYEETILFVAIGNHSNLGKFYSKA